MKQLVAIIVIGSLVACGGNDYPAQDKTIVPANSQSTNATPAINALPVKADSSNSDVQVITSPVPAQAAPAVTMAGMNPAHGEPNHRCDISVGAPLSSPVSKANAAATPQVQTVAAPVMSTAPVPTPIPAGTGTAKLNPAHGEPGHDCAKQVGAPLN